MNAMISTARDIKNIPIHFFDSTGEMLTEMSAIVLITKLTEKPTIMPATSDRRIALKKNPADQERLPLTVNALAARVMKINTTPIIQNAILSFIIFTTSFFATFCPFKPLLYAKNDGKPPPKEAELTTMIRGMFLK